MALTRRSQEARKENKYIMKDLFTQRIFAAVEEHRFPYKYFISNLPKVGIELDRKMLSFLAVHEPRTFESLIAICKSKVASDPVGEAAQNVTPHPGVVTKGRL